MAFSIQRATSDSDVEACFEVLSELRPNLKADDLLPAVRRMEREGYFLVFLRDDDRIQAVAGYRVIEMLRTGRMLEIDDLVTAGHARSSGCGRALMEWIRMEARARGCSVIELDSAVHRADAHRFYFREKMHVLGFHFSVSV